MPIEFRIFSDFAVLIKTPRLLIFDINLEPYSLLLHYADGNLLPTSFKIDNLVRAVAVGAHRLLSKFLFVIVCGLCILFFL